MAPIDYSKWDNIDTDSEDDDDMLALVPGHVPPANPVPAPAPSLAATALPVATASSTTTPSTASDAIQAVTISCRAEHSRGAWYVTSIPANHPIFSQATAPISRLIEMPLVFHRVGTQSPNRAALDNQMATYLNIDADSGFAPQEWQSHVGTVIVARKDKKPLWPQHLEGVWMYCDLILDYFGDGEGAPRRLYSRQAFEDWWETYREQEKENRGGKGGQRDPDDWRDVKSPYEI